MYNNLVACVCRRSNCYNALLTILTTKQAHSAHWILHPQHPGAQQGPLVASQSETECSILPLESQEAALALLLDSQQAQHRSSALPLTTETKYYASLNPFAASNNVRQHRPIP